MSKAEAAGRRGAAVAFRYGYFSPQWLCTLDDLSRIVHHALYLLIMVGAAALLIAANPLGFTLGHRVVAFIVALAFAGLGAWLLNGMLVRYGGGYGLWPNGSNTLTGSFEPGRITLVIDSRPLTIDALEPHQFLMREHPDRIEEARAEERARAFGYGMQPDFFRRSFEVLLDYGVARVRLAEVAYESQARDMVRHLQQFDAYARGSAGAGTRTRAAGEAGGSPLGKRPVID